MESSASGLRFRLRRAARQIAEQHRHLGELVRALESAFAAGRTRDAEALLERYCAAVEAHFALEEEVFFPALHGLHPEHGEELEALAIEHRAFARDLARLGEPLPASGLDERIRAFRAHQQQMGVHESREEQVARELTAEPPEDAVPS